MNFRNKPLQDVFDERYKANHNKEMQKEAQNNRRNLMDRMLGNNNGLKANDNQKVDNRPIGYNGGKKNW